MNIIHCDQSNVDLAVNAMVNIKCVEDGLPIELMTDTAMKAFLDNPYNHLLVAFTTRKRLVI